MIDEVLDMVAMILLFIALLVSLLMVMGAVNASLDSLARDFDNFVRAVIRIAG